MERRCHENSKLHTVIIFLLQKAMSQEDEINPKTISTPRGLRSTSMISRKISLIVDIEFCYFFLYV